MNIQNKSDIALAYLTLFSGLTISAVAIWYSVIGLVAIFAAATIPIIVMGTALEVSKLVATLWLKWNWSRAPILIRAYLLSAITVLMLLTSMGIFGFLSKAHLDQGVPTSDIAANVALIDEKIKTERDNIDAARRALQQMDATVDQTISRSTSEQGATRAAQLRRSQAKERAQLQKDITESQKKIAALNSERAPIASELRKVEAEVGPIKYIASLIYGDNPDANLLERAVRWVIIVIVLVFDPLAVILLLASQYSFQWLRLEKKKALEQPLQDKQEGKEEPTPKNNSVTEEVIDLEDCPKCGTKMINATGIGLFCPNKECDVFDGPLLYEPVEDAEPIDDDSIYDDSTKEDIIAQSEESVVQEEIKEPIIEEADDITDDEVIENEQQALEKEAMKRWKKDNPNDSLKHQRRLFELKIIDKLPWQDYLAPKPDYVQNGEQGNKTIWQRIKKK